MQRLVFPKGSVWRTLIVFELLLLLLMAWLVDAFAASPAWGYVLGLAVLLLIAVLLLVRLVLGQRSVYVSPQQIKVRYHLLRQEKTWGLQELSSWQEVVVSGFGKRPYKQLQVSFGEADLLRIGSEEFEGYPALKKYLHQKASTKMITAKT